MTSTNSWTDAVANAKSYIVVTVRYDSGVVVVSTIPKAELRNTVSSFLSGIYGASTRFWYVNIEATLSTANIFAQYNGSTVTVTVKYYYDY